MIHVASWGVAGSVQDAGRPGRAWLGAGRGGAVDRPSLALANRLVGNDEACAAFETSGGLTITTTKPTMVAVTGGVAHITVESGPPVGWGMPVVLPAGATLRVGRMMHGARIYVSVRGGIINSGDAMHAGPDPHTPAALQPAARHEPSTNVRLWPGPRLDWFDDDALQILTSNPFVVTDTSRVGSRLSGESLRRVRHDELPSEGMVEGSMQVPPDGNPIVMLAGYPATGGYPVIAVVDPADIHLVGQAAVGTELRFRLT